MKIKLDKRAGLVYFNNMTNDNSKQADIRIKTELDGTYTVGAVTEAGIKYMEKQICFAAVSVNVTCWSEALKHIVSARAWNLIVNDRGHLIG